MGCHRVEPDAKVVHVIGYIVCLHDRICDRSFFGLCRISLFTGHLLYSGSLCLGDDFIAVYKVNTAVIQFNHCYSGSLCLGDDFIAVYKVNTAVIQFNHCLTSSCCVSVISLNDLMSIMLQMHN